LTGFIRDKHVNTFQKLRNSIRFSDYFELGKTQAQLDFVDIPLDTDISLFFDPYALYIGKMPWFVEANNLVVDYFDHLLAAIKSGNQLEAIRLLANFREPNDARLGWSTGKPDGRGIGAGQARELYVRFRDSKAVQSGSLRDLLDCELMIPGISSDKISDMTVNIVRPLLVEYTQEQCALWNIPVENVEAGIGWDGERHGWVNQYAELPTYKGRGIILIPKGAVRRRLEANHEDYLSRGVIPFLRAEEMDARSGLVQLLRNGKKVVYRKDLEEKYFNRPDVHIKDQLHDFTEKHPEVLERYKKEKSEQSHAMSDYELEDAQAAPRELGIRNVCEHLKSIAQGRAQANEFHELCIGVMTTIFGGSLHTPRKEQPIHNGRKRIDITYNNGSTRGFFHNLTAKYGIKCPYVFVECKNYSGDPENPELDQLIGRFGRERGNFGILVCRKVEDESLLVERCRDIAQAGRGYVLFLTDEDLAVLASRSASGNVAGIDEYMQRKLDALLLN
jgi:hypothetical protein